MIMTPGKKVGDGDGGATISGVKIAFGWSNFFLVSVQIKVTSIALKGDSRHPRRVYKMAGKQVKEREIEDWGRGYTVMVIVTMRLRCHTYTRKKGDIFLLVSRCHHAHSPRRYSSCNRLCNQQQRLVRVAGATQVDDGGLRY